MEFVTRVKVAVYGHLAQTGQSPSPDEIAGRIGSDPGAVLGAYRLLRQQRVLVLEADGSSIRMALPCSCIPTHHVVESGGVEYYANCVWDALGVAATLHQPAVVHSRCEGSREPLQRKVGRNGPEPSDRLFHCLVPAAHWWDDIVFT